MPPPALVLEQKYGKGPPKSAAEVLDFRLAMDAAGVPKASSCVVAAWLGGAPAEKYKGWKFWDWTGRETAQEVCEREDLDGPSVTQALQELRQANAPLADLVEVKAGQHQARQEANEQRNIDEDTAKFWSKVDDLLTVDVGGLKVSWRHVLGLLALLVLIAGGVKLWRWARAA